MGFGCVSEDFDCDVRSYMGGTVFCLRFKCRHFNLCDSDCSTLFLASTEPTLCVVECATLICSRSHNSSTLSGIASRDW